MLIREARLRAGLSQVELSERSGKDRAQLARWERDVVQPSFEISARALAREWLRSRGDARSIRGADKQSDARFAEDAPAFSAGSGGGNAQGPPRLMPEADPFDPIAVLQALDRHRVSYVVIGGLGRVIHGSDEITHGIDIVPSTKPENIRRPRSVSLGDVNARRSDGKA